MGLATGWGGGAARRGGWGWGFRRIQRTGDRPIQVETLDLGGSAGTFHQGGDFPFKKPLANRLTRFLIRGWRRGAALIHPDHMPAEGAADGGGAHFTGPQGEGRFGEFGHHVTALEKAEIPAFTRPGA